MVFEQYKCDICGYRSGFLTRNLYKDNICWLIIRWKNYRSKKYVYIKD